MSFVYLASLKNNLKKIKNYEKGPVTNSDAKALNRLFFFEFYKLNLKLFYKFYYSLIITYGLILILSFIYAYNPSKSEISLYNSSFCFLETYLQ